MSVDVEAVLIACSPIVDDGNEALELTDKGDGNGESNGEDVGWVICIPLSRRSRLLLLADPLLLGLGATPLCGGDSNIPLFSVSTITGKKGKCY